MDEHGPDNMGVKKNSGPHSKTGREILRECRTRRTEVLILQEKLEELRAATLPKTAQIKDRVQTNPARDLIGERLSEVVEMEKQIKSTIAQMYEVEALALKIIRQIKDSRYRCLLMSYYMTVYKDMRGRMRLHTFETVAEENGYCPETMRHYHGRALIAADKAAEELSI